MHLDLLLSLSSIFLLQKQECEHMLLSPIASIVCMIQSFCGIVE